jgi:hypothetical protein
MDAIVFVRNYNKYLNLIGKVVKEEYQPIVDKLREIDPHDLVRPDTFFDSEQSALGYVFNLFLIESKKLI